MLMDDKLQVWVGVYLWAWDCIMCGEVWVFSLIVLFVWCLNMGLVSTCGGETELVLRMRLVV